MILVQAVVVAEALRREPKPGVVAWLDAQLHESLYLAASCAAALLWDFAKQPAQRRETAGEQITDKVFALFEDRILPFDRAAQAAYGEIMEYVRYRKRTIGRRDAWTAAIAKANGLVVACRNESPFLAAGLTVTNPWRF